MLIKQSRELNLTMLQKLSSFIALSLMLSCNSVARAQTAQMDAVANESGGQYAPMNMGYAGFNSLGMAQTAWLDPLQNLGEGQSRPAYSKYYWSPDLVLPIRLREGMLTLINFPNWEMVEDVFIGDNATFDGQISGPNTVLLWCPPGTRSLRSSPSCGPRLASEIHPSGSGLSWSGSAAVSTAGVSSSA